MPLRFKFIPRKAWTNEPPGGDPFNSPKGELYQHHTAGPMPEGGRKATPEVERALIRATRAFHVGSRGMSDIAYSYLFMPSGRAYVGRGFRSGGHTFNHNSVSLALCAFGNYSIAKPSEEMQKSIVKAAKKLRKKKRLTKNFVFRGHRDVGAEGGGTACPGNFLYAMLPAFRRALKVGR
jgi:hypothetical protein